jgi:hypothetical protein
MTSGKCYIILTTSAFTKFAILLEKGSTYEC